MLERNPKRLLVVAILLAGGIACSKQTTMLEVNLEPGQSYENAEVETQGGAYRFDRVRVTPDSLVGEYSVEVQRRSGSKEIYYEDVIRTQALPRRDVVALTTKQRDAERTLFFGAGAVAIGLLLRDVFDTELGIGGGGSSRTKPDPNG